jgi:hypothetical protein
MWLAQNHCADANLFGPLAFRQHQGKLKNFYEYLYWPTLKEISQLMPVCRWMNLTIGTRALATGVT